MNTDENLKDDKVSSDNIETAPLNTEDATKDATNEKNIDEKANDGQTDQPVKKSRAKERIEQLLEKNKQSEVEKKELQEKLKYYESLQKPDAEKYDDDDEYEIDRQAYITKKAQEKDEKERLKKLQEREQQEFQATFKEAERDFSYKIAAAPADIKKTIAENASRFKPRPKHVEMDVLASDYGVQIFDVILKDVDRFNNMSDTQFMREVAKIEARFEDALQVKKVPISNPEPPIQIQSNLSAGQSKKEVPLWSKVNYAQGKRMVE